MSSSATEQLVDVPMPHMGTSITEGEVIAWLKKPGDPVEADETICEVSTDKVDTECPAPVSGVLVEILVGESEVAEVGAVMARIATGEVPPVASEERPPVASDEPAPAKEEPAAAAGGDSANGAGGEGPARRFYSPVAKRLAAANGVDLDLVTGTGQRGRVTKKDVERFIEAGGEGPRLHSDSPYRPDPSSPDDLGGIPEPLSRMRRSIGAAMLRSLGTAATCHTVVECDVSGLERRRRELGVTALPLVAAAVIDVLGRFPDLNATLEEETITRYRRVHMGIAVSLGDDGLIVPVIRDAQELSVEGLSSRIKDLARRARSKQLLPDEVQGATFTITNPGAFGASIATPVIDLPQVGILDLEAIVRRPVVVGDQESGESIAIRSMVNLVLGWDHRAIDGVYAARFLSELRDRLQE